MVQIIIYYTGAVHAHISIESIMNMYADEYSDELDPETPKG